MKRAARIILTLLPLWAAGPARPAESFDDAMRREAAVYREREKAAAETLMQVRRRLADEKAPLLQQLRAAEDRLIAAETETRRIDVGQERAAEQRRALIRQIDEQAKSATYANTLAHEALKAVGDGLGPGEAQLVSDQIDGLLTALEKAPPGSRAQSAADATEYLVACTEQAIGGHTGHSSSLYADDNQLYSGTFVFLGPETLFRSDDGSRFGSARMRDGGKFPTVHPVREWTAAQATAVFTGGAGLVPADASGGKALRLAETKGSVWQHVRKGGVVAFAIIAAGLLALAMIIQKIAELFGMGIEPPEKVRRLLDALSSGDLPAAEHLVAQMHGASAELFAAGLAQRDAPQAALEEFLESVLLEQRLRYERRLPLLAVIATASPLMGLLGTVVGMVRTFALITVFGTGNAGKLSSGISEVLVATELGLIVAIPTLIAHGFLAHRIHKNLAALEKYAREFVSAVAAGRTEHPARALAL